MPQPTPLHQQPASTTDTLQFDVVRHYPIRVSRAEILSGLTDDDVRAECARRGIHEPVSPGVLTSDHIRGARGLLDWTLHRLAEVSRVSVSTIKRIEDGDEAQSRPSKHAAIRRAFEAAGVRFVELDGCVGVVRAAPVRLQQAAE